MVDKDDVWEFYGETDPYFGVATVNRFKGENLDEASRGDFFRSGEIHIGRIWDEIESVFISDFRPKRAMDFGCGVGRLVVPMAARCAEMVGVDISDKMLVEARKNCDDRRIDNASFALSDEALSEVAGDFDLIHSFIVFQHINPKKGEKIFRRMTELLVENGVGVVHFSINHRAASAERFRFRLYRDHPIFYRLRMLLKSGDQPQLIPMYEYDLNRLFLILQENGCHKCAVRFSYHGFDGVVILFQKTKAETY